MQNTFIQNTSIEKKSFIYYFIFSCIMAYGFGSTISLSASHLDFMPALKVPLNSQPKELIPELLKQKSTSIKLVSDANSPEIWGRVRDRLKLKAPASTPLLKRHIHSLSQHQDYFNKVVSNATPFLYFILEEVEKRGMPAEIALLPIIESDYNPHDVSNKGASGIWQLMPQLGRLHGLKQNSWYDGRRDVYESTRVALNHLEYLHKKFDGNWYLALAAYNAGEVRVLKAMKQNRSAKKGTDYWSLKLPKETTHFVPKLIALATIIKTPQKYGVNLQTIPNRPVFARIQTHKAIDIAHAAKLAQTSEKHLRKLNPGLKKTSSPQGPIHLLVPIHQAEGFKRKMGTPAPAASQIVLASAAGAPVAKDVTKAKTVAKKKTVKKKAKTKRKHKHVAKKKHVAKSKHKTKHQYVAKKRPAAKKKHHTLAKVKKAKRTRRMA